MYKILNNFTPEYLYDMVEQCLPVSHNYSLRNNKLFHIPITRTVAYYNSFVHQQLSYGTLCQTV